MKKIQNALLLYPHQLFSVGHLPQVDLVYVVEDPIFFGEDQEYPLSLHKQKLVLHRASMRRYVEEQLWPNNIDVEYIELGNIQHSGEILQIAQKAGAVHVMMFDPCDKNLETKLQGAVESIVSSPFELQVLPSPGFLLRRGEVEDYFKNANDHDFGDFYQWQRERFNVLIDKKYKPVGGKWIHDHDDKKALPAGHIPPCFSSFGANDYVDQAIKWVHKRFGANPGQIDSFIWPTNHAEATKWLDEFLKERLELFGQYNDAIDGQAMLLYHSGISGALNIGLLTPDQVINSALQYYSKNEVPLESLEGFIRQILGWREYVRGIYVVQGDFMRTTNTLGAQRPLGQVWYDGTTGLPPVDDVISKVNAHAYAHQNERMMIMGNIMLLCEIAPDDIYKWFMSLFIDAYDWVTVPNVYGMDQLSDLGSMVTKPYVSSSSYILKVSHYQKDVWCDTWDGLFWNFVEKHQEILTDNPQTKLLVNQLKKLDKDRHRIIGYRAQDFLNSI